VESIRQFDFEVELQQESKLLRYIQRLFDAAFLQIGIQIELEDRKKELVAFWHS
jgi:hypothetical protein